MMMLISEARLWVCEGLKPQGPMKPTVMETPVPIRVGKDLRSAATVRPPAVGLRKSSLKEGGERRLMRSAAVGARVSFSMRARS